MGRDRIDDVLEAPRARARARGIGRADHGRAGAPAGRRDLQRLEPRVARCSPRPRRSTRRSRRRSASRTASRIKVAILNGSGKSARKAGIPIELVIQTGGAAGAVLTGDLVKTNSDGVAVFEPTIDLEGLITSSSPRPRTTPPSTPGTSRRPATRRSSTSATAMSPAARAPAPTRAPTGGTHGEGRTRTRTATSSSVSAATDVACAGGASDSQTVKFDVVTDTIDAADDGHGHDSPSAAPTPAV